MTLSTQDKISGRVYTPPDVARTLTDWAVCSSEQKVLDLGVGEGVFTFAAIQRLIALGASNETASNQVLGAEQNEESFKEFIENAESALGFVPHSILWADFFDCDFGEVDAVVGNPPYVQRLYLTEIDHIRQRVLTPFTLVSPFGRLTDLYCYFILHGSRFLRSGGRLAVVLSSSWLDSDYGRSFKRFLLARFQIRSIVGFQGKLFPEALIKSVLLFAERCESPKPSAPISFLRISGQLDGWNPDKPSVPKDSHIYVCDQDNLDPDEPWSLYLKEPIAYQTIASNFPLTPLCKLAHSRIGLQTLARSFYILPVAKAKSLGIESRYLSLVAVSPREITPYVIDDRTAPQYLLFSCDDPPEKLIETMAGQYIKESEKRVVNPRGTAKSVVGVQNAPRIARANRSPWYNIKREMVRRGVYPILLPRRTYIRFAAIYNKEAWVPNEDFIEIRPTREEHIVPMLAILNSFMGEIIVRCRSQLYGGGVFNLIPGDVRFLPIPDLRVVSDNDLERLSKAFWALAHAKLDRKCLSEIVCSVFSVNPSLLSKWEEALIRLREMSTASKRNGH